MTDRPAHDDAVRILAGRYPELDQPGADPRLVAALAAVRLAVDVDRAQGAPPPVSRRELAAAAVLLPAARPGVELADVLGTAALRALGSDWGEIALLRGEEDRNATGRRYARALARLGVPEHALPIAPTMDARRTRARALVEAAAAGGETNPYIKAAAADLLAVLLLAAAHDDVSAADLRAWCEDGEFAAAAEGIGRAPAEEAAEAQEALRQHGQAPLQMREAVHDLVLRALDVYDPPTRPGDPA